MKLKNSETGEADFSKMPYLMGLFDEICFDQLIFKSPQHDMCGVMKQAVYENHGFSRILGISINR